MRAIRTLVLSGGGGRGAFQAGVYDYLSQAVKPGITDEYRGPWIPDIIVGTSIGAVNGAAIVQGIDPEEIIDFWESVREEDIEGLPPNMSGFTRMITNAILKPLIGVHLPKVPARIAVSTTPPGDSEWKLLPGLGKWADLILGRWSNLLDNGPLLHTIGKPTSGSKRKQLGLDEEKIAQSEKILLINTTDIRTGQRVTFSNHPVQKRSITGLNRPEIITGITLNRIRASASIPIVYPWTYDKATNSYYWDGAVVANTSMGGALDAASRFNDEYDMEIIVVLMTPWRRNDELHPDDQPELPRNFGEAASWALDWSLLAPFREQLKLIEVCNQLREIALKSDDPEIHKYRKFRKVRYPIIIAPEGFTLATRIIDYDTRNKELIKEGRRAASKVFKEKYGAQKK